jgi:hypothetical protein
MKIFSPILKGTTTVAQGTTNLSGSFTGSLFGTAATASYADNFTVGGTLTAQTINVQIITSSIEFNTGSTRNGALSTNTHEFTGSVLMSGSLNVGGALSGTSATFSGNITSNGNTISVINASGSADLVLDRLNTSSGATYQYKTNGSLKWYTGLRGLANDSFYIFNNATSTNTLILDVSTNAATFSSTVTAKNALILTPEVSGNYETNGALSYYSTTNGVYLNGAGVSGWLRLNAAGSENNQTTIDLYGSTQSTSPSTILFRTANSERMRIPSTGGILVGQSSKWNAGVDNSFRTEGASSWTLNANSLNTGSPYLLLITTGRNTSSDLLINCETNHASLGGSATTGRFRVDGAGIIYATNTTVQSISDIRTKENIIDAESGLNIINNLKVRRFDFKDGFGDNKKNQLGFIAQEIETVFPEAVGLIPKTSDSQDNDIQYKTVGPGALIPVLTKAIQELKSENDTLKEILQRNNIQ